MTVRKLFEHLSIPRKEAKSLLASRYRVYKDAENFTVVEATNAAEALKAANATEAFRIERDGIFLYHVLDKDLLNAPAPISAPASATAEPQATAEATAVAAPPPAAPAAPAADAKPAAVAPLADKALSGDEVNKLLQG